MKRIKLNKMKLAIYGVLLLFAMTSNLFAQDDGYFIEGVIKERITPTVSIPAQNQHILIYEGIHKDLKASKVPMRVIATNQDGKFKFPVPAGIYTIALEIDGQRVPFGKRADGWLEYHDLLKHKNSDINIEFSTRKVANN